MKAQHPEGDNLEKVAPKGVGRGGNMANDKKKPTKANVKLSLEHIKRFFDALPSSAVKGDLAKKKENADAALEYLDYFFNAKVGDVMTASKCGPRPHIPELP
jgi:hypothetical protein